MENTEKVKNLNDELLESVSGGMIMCVERCELCGSDYKTARIDGQVYIVCSNPECLNAEYPQMI